MSKAAKAAFVFWPTVFLLIGSSFVATKVYAQAEHVDPTPLVKE